MTYDVFLSHNSREKPIVERLALALRECGLQPWFDKWHVTPGGRWQEDLAAGLKASKSCAVFVGPHDAGDWEREEVGVALEHAARNRSYRVFLVLLPGVAEPFDPSTLSPFLSTRTWVDLRKGADGSRSVQALVNAVNGVPLAPAVTVDVATAVCPYRGLLPFDEEHAEFYFGRDAEIQRLIEQLKSSPFLAVLGPSGSGKSSLVRAGLLPALRKGALPGSQDWPIRVFTPGADPLSQLAAQVCRLGPCGTMSALIDSMTTDVRGLHLATTLALGDRPSSTRVLWVVDQFEEIFTLCRSEEARVQFIANLLQASSPSGRSTVVITLRADFYHRCAAYPDLAAKIAARQYLVSPMDEDGLRRAIEEPARLAGLEFEEGLVDTIVEDVGKATDALPLLEHSLLELWERRRARMVTLEGYRESGGLQGAIAQRAESIHAALDESGRATSRRVLLRLTQIGEGSEDTRRRAAVSELVTRPTDAATVEEVVQRWTDGRLLTMTAGDDGERWVTVSHEALIRAWPRLRGWIDADRAGQALHRQITEDARDWRQLGKDESALLRGLRLAQAVDFRGRHEDALNDSEREFLDASVALQQREVAQRDRRRRQIVLSLSAGMLVALTLAGLAAWQWRRAAQAQQVAEQEQRRTTVQALSAQWDVLRTYAQSIVTGWPAFLEEGALVAIESHGLGSDPKTARGLRAAADILPSSVRDIPVRIDADFSGVNFSAVRDEIAFALLDKRTVQLLSLASGKTTHALTASGDVARVVYSPRGTFLAIFTGSAVELWSLGDTPRQVWTKGAGPFSGLGKMFPGAFSPDEHFMAWIAGHETILADTRNGDELRRLTHSDEVVQVVFSGDGSRLASGGGNSAEVLTLATGVVKRISVEGRVAGVSLDQRGRILATLDSGQVSVWEVGTGDQVANIRAFRGGEDAEYVLMATLDASGARLGVLGEYGTAKQFSVTSGQLLWQMDYSGDDRVLFSLSPPFVAAKTPPGIELWDATEGRPQARVLHKTNLDDVRGAFYSAETGRLVLLSEERIWAYDTNPGSEMTRAAFHLIDNVIRSRDRRLVALQSDDRVAVVEAASGRELWRRDRIQTADLSADGRFMAAVLKDDTLVVWEVASGKAIWRQAGIPHVMTEQDADDEDVIMPNVQKIVFGTQSDRVALAFRKTPPRGWELPGGRELSAAEAGTLTKVPADTASGTATSIDGRWRAQAKEGEVTITDTVAKRDVATIHHDADPTFGSTIEDLQFSHDGRFLLTGGRDRTARIWDLSGRELSRINVDASVVAVAFDADARHVTTVTRDGRVQTWMWRDEDLVEAVCSRLTRNLTTAEWQTHFGTDAYRLTCAGLPKPEVPPQ